MTPIWRVYFALGVTGVVGVLLPYRPQESGVTCQRARWVNATGVPSAGGNPNGNIHEINQ